MELFNANIVNILLWVILGGVAGWVASLVMDTDHQMGPLANIVVGIVGAFLGGIIMTYVFAEPGVTGFNIYSLIVAIIGAVILLFATRLVRRS